ncbi:TPA: LOW QUALITY PROTEIN: hypothetical protein N0F65_000849 [Lagenidium giganteum]|uniref:Integrase catalytic domain-containing protein n=1 Tax=Lagenidium giganteum TaxID=4803 RepID=A0AAV2Z1Q0_9STRA|nr:TPA: LOW QUALITY PROTEIN: hypothetical protein N0F65_000849 [Lagenidium giganteum]
MLNIAIAHKIQLPMVGCASHRLNLAVRRVLEPWTSILDRVHLLMMPLLRNDTRWSSTFAMIDHYLNIKDKINRARQDLHLNVLLLEDDDFEERTPWMMMTEVLLTEDGTPLITTSNSSEWIIDSGCSQHMCQAHKNSQRQIVGIGTVELLVVNKANQVMELRLHNVLFVPALRKTRAAHRVRPFQMRYSCAVTRDAFCARKQDNGLYVLKDINSTQHAYKVFSEPSYALWHKRLGHHNYDGIRSMATNSSVRGLKLSERNQPLNRICDACELDKKYKNSFQTTKRLDRTQCNSCAHTNICGPVEVPALNGTFYVVDFVDDYSRYIHIYPLVQRHEYYQVFVHHVTFTQNQHNTPLVSVYSDNGGEYVSDVSDAVKSFCDGSGIHRSTTITHTLEQNGLAEQFWLEAVQAVVYIQNRVPYRGSRHTKTPYEIWFDHAPDVSMLRVFRCLCYVHVPMKDRRRSRPRKVAKARLSRNPRAFSRWHVIFAESDLPAATETRRLELSKLSRRLKLSIDYYTRTAISDLLFHDHTPVNAHQPARRTGKVRPVHYAAVLPLLKYYDPKAHARLRDCVWVPLSLSSDHKRLPAESRNPVITLSRGQGGAEMLVAIENAQTKIHYDALAANAVMPEPRTFAEAVSAPDRGCEIVAIHVDDLLLVTKCERSMAKLKHHIASKFNTDQGPVIFSLALGSLVTKNARRLWVSQEANADAIIDKLNLTHANPSITPTTTGCKLRPKN